MNSDLDDEETALALTLYDRLQLYRHVDEVAMMTARQLQRAAIEIERHRAMVKRLEDWAVEFDRSADGNPAAIGLFLAKELRNRMNGVK